MRTRFYPLEQRSLLKFVSAALLAGACAACSDSGRFGDNAFTNPFATASAPAAPKVDRTTTASIPNRTAPMAPVTSQPLPPPMPRAAVTNPITSTPLPSASTIVPQSTPRVASNALRTASPVGGAATGWTAAGGTPVTTGAGDTADALSARYGVPASAILAANGGQVRPGQQVIIPVYNSSSAAPKAAAAAAPVAPAVQRATPLTNPITRPVQPTPTAAAPQQRPVVVAAAKPAKPEADDDDEDDKPAGRIVAAAPKAGAAPALAPARPIAQAQQPRAVTAQQAKPIRPATPAPSTQDDDDEEDDKPAKKTAEKPAAPAAQARTQPRVIPMTPTAPERPQVAEVPRQAEPQTTQSIPPTKPQQQAAAPATPAPAPAPAEAAGDKPEFRWPARGRVISGFGARGGNGDGIAIAVPEGTPVKAAEGGTVAYSGEELKGYGKMILIRHDNGYVSAYAHNGELNVKRGDRVSRGQVVAKSGATGNVTSPQLHFELRRGSTPVDPTKYLDN
jgi:murein DD-endopeptidase MepM/ murein hydrolase activator NlpD